MSPHPREEPRRGLASPLWAAAQGSDPGPGHPSGPLFDALGHAQERPTGMGSGAFKGQSVADFQSSPRSAGSRVHLADP